MASRADNERRTAVQCAAKKWLKTIETILICQKPDRSLLHLVSEFQLLALSLHVAEAGLSFGNWLVI